MTGTAIAERPMASLEAAERVMLGLDEDGQRPQRDRDRIISGSRRASLGGLTEWSPDLDRDADESASDEPFLGE